MIKVLYHRDRNRLSVSGHAKSGEKGHDLVCASVSILCYTLAALVKNMENAAQARYPTVKLSEGDALIDCKVPNKYKSTVTFAFDSICAGFDMLAQNYPDNISYEIRK